MFHCIVLYLGLVAALVAGHEGHDESSAAVYTTVMVHDGVTMTMAMTAEASGHPSATDAATPTTTASEGLARPTVAPFEVGVAGLAVAALAGIGL